MTIKILPASEVRNKLAKVLDELTKDKEPVYVTQYGKAKAVLLDVERYNSFIRLLEDLEDIRDFRLAEGESVKDFDDVMAELEGRSSASA